MPYIGTRWVTHNVAVDNQDYVVSTEPIVVHSVIVTYDGVSKRRPELRDNDDNVLATMSTTNTSSGIFTTRWLAGNGLKIVALPGSVGASQYLYVSVLYSQGE
jgi:hypothetical protein